MEKWTPQMPANNLLRRPGNHKVLARGRPLNEAVRPHSMQRTFMRTFGSVLAAIVIAACSDSSSPERSVGTGYVVKCTEPLPEFTLGPASKPTQAQETALCACIWARLGSWERRTSGQIARGKESEASAPNLRAFPARFGSAVEECGGMKL